MPLYDARVQTAFYGGATVPVDSCKEDGAITGVTALMLGAVISAILSQ